MARPLVSDELWHLVEPLIPKVERRYRFPGRKRIDDRKVLTGILFVLQTGIPWEYLPKVGRSAVEREFGRLKNEYGLTPLHTRGLPRVRQHADLVMIARLGQALVRARTALLAA
ncbi:MAG: transposase [Gaiellaceae bacterium]